LTQSISKARSVYLKPAWLLLSLTPQLPLMRQVRARWKVFLSSNRKPRKLAFWGLILCVEYYRFSGLLSTIL